LQNRSKQFWPEGLPPALNIPESGFSECFSHSARRDPGKTFINFYGSIVSWAQADRETDIIAGFLQSCCGLVQGDRVALYVQNSPQFVLAFHGALRAGGVVVPVNPMNVTDEVEHIIRDSGARIAFVADDLVDRLDDSVLSSIDHLITVTYGDYLIESPSVPVPEALLAPQRSHIPTDATRWSSVLEAAIPMTPLQIKSDDLATIAYTSGTTGVPKGCMNTHAAMTITAMGGALWEGLDENAVMLGVPPLCHMAGLQLTMNRCVYAGATLVLMHRWDPLAAADLIERHRVTHWNGVPLLISDLLRHLNENRNQLSSIRIFSGGGAAMPEAVAQQLKMRFGADFVEGYGMTETMKQTHLNPPARAKMQCLGIPTFNIEAVVADPETLAILQPDQVGEILVRGPQVFRGYWNNPDATRAAFVEIEGQSWFRTGDLGRIDAEGYFFFVDRLKRMINAYGYKVWPAEVEAKMFEHSSIRECCIIGSPDTRRGETVKAVVVLKDGVVASDETSSDILNWAKSEMAAYKVPRKIEFVAELPRSPTGKVDWRQLQRREIAS